MNFITGGTGLVGAHAALELVRKGRPVRLLSRVKSDRDHLRRIFSLYAEDTEALLRLVEWVEGDLNDVYSLEDALEGVDFVYHAAAMVSFVPADRKTMLTVNIEGTANLVNAALEKGVKKFCHVSSVATLAKPPGGGLINESHYWKTDPSNSWYAISKYGAEREAWRATEEGLDMVIVNPSLILGPGDWNRSSLETVRMAAKGLKWYPGGGTGFVDVRDVARAMVQLTDSEIVNERFILNGANLSFKELLGKLNGAFGKAAPARKASPFMTGMAWRGEKIMAGMAGRKPRITRETAAASQETNYFSGEKITQALPFTYTGFDQTITDVAAFFRKLEKLS